MLLQNENGGGGWEGEWHPSSPPLSATVFLHLHVNITYCVVSLVDISITTSAGPGRYIFFPTPVNKIRCGFVKLTK